MKAMKSLLLVLVLWPLAAAAQTVTLVNPDAGENYPRNGITNITWHYSGLSGTVRLILFQGSANLGIIADNLPLATNKYHWTVGQHANGTAPAGSNYHVRIRVTDPVNGGLVADGPAFTIGPANVGTMTVTSPTAETNWSLNQAHNITWSKSAGTHSIRVSIALLRGGVFQRWITNSTENDGVFAWFIPQSLASYPDNRLEIRSIYASVLSPSFKIGILRLQQPLKKDIKKLP